MSTLKTMEIFKKTKTKTKNKQNKKTKQTNKQTNKKKQQQQHGKIAVPFPGKFGKRKTAKKNITHAATHFVVFALTIRDDTSALWPRLIVTMVTRSNALSKKSGGTITLLHT